VRAGSEKAAAVIWRWREAEPERARTPSAASARVRGALQALVGTAFGAACWFWWSQTVAVVAFAAAGVVFLSAMLSPTGLYALLHRLFEWTGRQVGRMTTWIVMVPVFYLFFVPFGWLMRRGRRDRLHRWFEPEAETYWEAHVILQTSTRERQY
jgi:hypothetical protein